jgi:O-antigen ligase
MRTAVIPRRRHDTVLMHRLPSRLVSTIFSFECLFAIFICINYFKDIPSLQWAPVDLAVLFMGLSIISGLYVYLRRGFRVQHSAFTLILLFLIFAAYALASLAWTPGHAYAMEKVLLIMTYVFWSLAGAALIIAYDVRRLYRFMLAIFLFSCWVALETFQYYLQSGPITFVTPDNAYYLATARVLGLGALITLAYSLFWAPNAWVKVAAFILFDFFLFLLLVVGARGPLLATVIAALVPLLIGWRLRASEEIVLKRYVVPLIGIIAISFIVFVCYTSVFSDTLTIDRLLALLQPGMEPSAATRLSYYEVAIPLWLETPIVGHGIGSWPILIGLGDVRNYPHNIVLEIMVELGLIGLLLFIGMVIFGLRTLGSWGSIAKDPARILILMLFVNVFTNAQVTGDIGYNNVMFSIFGLLMLTRRSVAQAKGSPPKFRPSRLRHSHLPQRM